MLTLWLCIRLLRGLFLRGILIRIFRSNLILLGRGLEVWLLFRLLGLCYGGLGGRGRRTRLLLRRLWRWRLRGGGGRRTSRRSPRGRRSWKRASLLGSGFQSLWGRWGSRGGLSFSVQLRLIRGLWRCVVWLLLVLVLVLVSSTSCFKCSKESHVHIPCVTLSSNALLQAFSPPSPVTSSFPDFAKRGIKRQPAKRC